MPILDGATRYVVHQRFAEGGMGAVHLGTLVSPAGERRVAIKRLLAKTNASVEALERIRAEARLVFQLTHANICQVLDLAEDEDGTFIVMEYVEGCDLKALLDARREGEALDVADAIYIAREIATALDYAHRKRDANNRPLWLVHGDVTPRNVLLSNEGEVRLADFGIARALGTGPGDTLVAGTPGYMAPEVRGGRVDQRADIYSLGATLYAALTGRAPEPNEIDTPRPDVSSVLRTIIERCLARRPDQRFATAGELQRALSIHLAQKFPTFSPLALGRRVQAASIRPVVSTHDGTATTTLISLAGKSDDRPELATRALEGGSGTRRVAASSRRRPRRGIAIAAIAAIAVAGGAGVWQLRRVPVPAPAVAPTVASTGGAMPPPAADVTPSMTAAASPDAEPAALHEAPLQALAVVSPRTAPPRPSTGKPRQAAQPHPRATPESEGASPTKIGYVTVNAEPWGVVFVDGKRFADQTPLYRAPLAVGTHSITLYSPKRRVHAPEQKIVVRGGENTVVGFAW